MEAASTLSTGRYAVQEQLGAGSMGLVYRATDRLSGLAVALKRVMLAPDEANPQELLLALAHEFRTLASLRHPHIISVLDYGFDAERQPFFTMELLADAQNILVAGRNLPRAAQSALLIQALEALAYLHRRGVLHHDLKPPNMLVTADQLRLLDFGLAVLAGQERADDAFGTLQYLAPEVIDGQPYTAAADLYSLGVVAYELLIGRHPFDTQTVRSFLQQVRYQQPDLTMLADQPALVALLDRLLAKQPHARPDSTQAAVVALREAAGRPTDNSAAIRESYLQAATFVGRAAELAQLTGALDQAQRGRGSLWLIGGESGVGKSRLLDELRTHALVAGFRVLSGQAVEGGGLPYQLWRGALPSLLLETSLSDLEAGVLKAVVPLIGRMLGRGVPDAPALPGLGGPQRLADTIAGLFRQLRQPTLLLLEDLHWSRVSLPPLQLLLRNIADLPLLVVASYRNDERPTLPDAFPNAQLLNLKRLTPAAIALLSRAMLGAAGAQAQVVELLQRETEGNAFFLVEVVRALAEEAGNLEQVGQMLLPQAVLAGGVQQIVQRRLARMPEWGQALLKLAAVAGRQLDLNVLMAVTPQARDERWVNAGAEAAIFEMSEGQWRFNHEKLREAVLADLSESERPLLHRQVAEALEAVYPHDPARADVLLEHWRLAGDAAKEVLYIQHVVERNLDVKHNLPRNLSLLERGLTVLPALPDPDLLRMTMLRQLGDSQIELGQIAAAKISQQQSLALAQQLAHTVGHIQALRGLGVISWRAGDLPAATLQLQAALHLAQQTDQQDQIGSLLRLLGIMVSIQTQYADAEAYFQQALALHHARGEQTLATGMVITLGVVARLRKEFTQSAIYLTQALEYFQSIQDRYAIQLIQYNLSVLAFLQKDYAAALRYNNDALKHAYELNIQYSIVDKLFLYARVHIAQKQWDEAKHNLSAALSLAQKLKGTPMLLKALMGLVDFFYAQGQSERAAELAGLIGAHPATPRDEEQESLAPLLAELHTTLPADVLGAALARGKAFDVAIVVQQILAELAVEEPLL